MKQQKSQIKYSTISTVNQKDIHKLNKEFKGLADYIIVVDKNMTTTY